MKNASDRPGRPTRTGPTARRTTLAVAAVAALLGTSACSPGYVLRAGWEEAKLLQRRRPIPEVLADTTTPPEVRRKLELVVDARRFAERSLGLEPGDSFTSYAEVGSDTLLLVVSAAPPFSLAWKTWWFPIVGDVPYRGYFDFGEALEEARELEEEGYDTYVRPTAAFSTLGWLPDPTLSTFLRRDSVGIVETVIHEVTHTTYFPPGHADFNESFANFAGRAGAVAYFCEGVGEAPCCHVARARWHDARVYGRFLTDLRERLAALYASGLGEEEMARRKREILTGAASRYEREVAPRFRDWPAGRLEPGQLDNAWLLSRVLYHHRLDDFDTVWRARGTARDAIRAVIEAARDAPDPWTGLDRLLGETEGKGR